MKIGGQSLVRKLRAAKTIYGMVRVGEDQYIRIKLIKQDAIAMVRSNNLADGTLRNCLQYLVSIDDDGDTITLGY